MLLDNLPTHDPGQPIDLSPVSAGGSAAIGGSEPSAPLTFAERATLGIEAGHADGVAIVPFTEGWDRPNIFIDLDGPLRTEIANRLNDGWLLVLYRYRDEEGRVILIILRLDHPTGDGPKFIRPLRVRRMAGIRADVVSSSLPAPRPLYALDQIAKRPTDPILFVEGEKAADAGAAHFPDHVVTTWPGGADGVASTDLRAMAGRDAVIWPDNDAAGAGAARKLGQALLAAGAASVRVVPVPKSFPPKWDIADPVPGTAHG